MFVNTLFFGYFELRQMAIESQSVHFVQYYVKLHAKTDDIRKLWINHLR